MKWPSAVTEFEEALKEVTGAPFVVATQRCCTALEMCCRFLHVEGVIIPRRTYNGVVNAIRNSGGYVKCDDRHWTDCFQLDPYPIWDFAQVRQFLDIYRPGEFVCLSFGLGKILNVSTGGAIVHDSPDADAWFRRAGYDGRTPGVPPAEDDFLRDAPTGGPMPVGIAAQLHAQLYHKMNRNRDYPDLVKAYDLDFVKQRRCD